MDTSALYALLDRDDANHTAAAGAFPSLLEETLLTHNYVLVETTALVQSRLGGAAVAALLEDLVPAISVRFIGAELHRAAVSALLAAARRAISLVDWVSFEVMREGAMETAFAFDRDFAAQGFSTVP